MSALHTEDLEFVLPGEKMPPPVNLGGLKADLGVEQAPRDVQDAAIREWLCHNTPSDGLRYFLEKAGYMEADYKAS